MPVPPLSRWRATLNGGWLAGIFSNFFSFMSWYFSTMTITVNSIDRGITRFAHSPTDRPWLLSIYWILLDSRSSPPSSQEGQLFGWSGNNPNSQLARSTDWQSIGWISAWSPQLPQLALPLHFSDMLKMIRPTRCCTAKAELQFPVCWDHRCSPEP